MLKVVVEKYTGFGENHSKRDEKHAKLKIFKFLTVLV
jgi:hypothetical protein